MLPGEVLVEPREDLGMNRFQPHPNLQRTAQQVAKFERSFPDQSRMTLHDDMPGEGDPFANLEIVERRYRGRIEETAAIVQLYLLRAAPELVERVIDLP